jgi:hypothetical protein
MLPEKRKPVDDENFVEKVEKTRKRVSSSEYKPVTPQNTLNGEP